MSSSLLRAKETVEEMLDPFGPRGQQKQVPPDLVPAVARTPPCASAVASPGTGTQACELHSLVSGRRQPFHLGLTASGKSRRIGSPSSVEATSPLPTVLMVNTEPLF